MLSRFIEKQLYTIIIDGKPFEIYRKEWHRLIQRKQNIVNKFQLSLLSAERSEGFESEGCSLFLKKGKLELHVQDK